MIVADTNVISELSRQALAPEVVSSLDSLAAGDVATTAITAAELLYSVARLPDGRRKTELSARFTGCSATTLAGEYCPLTGWLPAGTPRSSPVGNSSGTRSAQPTHRSRLSAAPSAQHWLCVTSPTSWTQESS
jgi:hypothetical protein